MGMIRILGAVVAPNGKVAPVYSGPVTAAVSFSITNGVASIVLGAANLPKVGYNGPKGYPVVNGVGTPLDITGGVSGSNNAGGSNQGGGAANGQQVTLWNFTTATYFNGVTVTVLDNDPSTGTFRFYFNHANVASTGDVGNTAPIPTQHYRVVRLEVGQSAGTDLIFVGDGTVSPTRYMAALSLAGQLAIEIASENVPADRLFIITTGAGGAADNCQVTLIY